jgi:NAD(P)H-dependent FMN reductase
MGINTMNTKLKIKVVLGSVRQERNADKVWVWLEKQLAEFGKFDIELLDLKQINLPLFNESSSPAQGLPHETEAARNWSAKMAEADGYIIVTPEYDHTLPGALRNAFDYLANEWNKKAVGIVSYGAAGGGARASEAMKASLTYMETVVLPVEVNIPNIWAAFDGNGDLPDNYSITAQKMFASLEWWSQLLNEARAKLPTKVAA